MKDPSFAYKLSPRAVLWNRKTIIQGYRNLLSSEPLVIEEQEANILFIDKQQNQKSWRQSFELHVYFMISRNWQGRFVIKTFTWVIKPNDEASHSTHIHFTTSYYERESKTNFSSRAKVEGENFFLSSDAGSSSNSESNCVTLDTVLMTLKFHHTLFHFTLIVGSSTLS